MAKLTKIKTRPKGGATEILVLVNHPMETGNRVNAKTKEKIPAHFIQKLTVEVNGKAIAVADLGVAVSKDPLIGVAVKAKTGDKVKVNWSDNKGETGTAETAVG
ncbi:MAG: thiosulfate oxidation carrier complex protein SoxZ [Candidatus Muproteobacteria bacterium RBG_16_64_11]|uniref:Thiosulfate oxidation carrier complex protein SoxZ n=1 Tax=Candidatus Muproteobacteria bacterium RBG_16_64_11 TaxID=1817758 RepID=A0A1F6TA41_9PROT|nr:MAG: thiosulfate oxidation carrier complex protein SoxZ [Candidatus Muproteobacteria bacterium RBG_16_64_11]